MSTTTDTLFNRFRAALAGDKPSDELATLSADIGNQRSLLNGEADALEAKSLDPTVAPGEARAARDEAASLGFDEARLASAAEQVTALHKAAKAREQNEDRLALRQRATEARDAAVGSIRKEYPALAEKLLRLVTLASEADALVRQSAAARPDGAGVLETVEDALGVPLGKMLNLPAIGGGLLHEADHEEMSKLREAAFQRQQQAFHSAITPPARPRIAVAG